MPPLIWKHRGIQGAVLVILSSVLTLLVLEWACRVMGLGRPNAAVVGPVTYRWVPRSPFERVADPILKVRLRAAYRGAFEYVDGGGTVFHRVEVRTNNVGLRGPDVSLAPRQGVRRVLALGDSCTFGHGVAEQHAWPAQLGAQLGRGDEVLNGGVPSWALVQQVRWLSTVGVSLAPALVVLALFVNDLEVWSYPPGDDPQPSHRREAPPEAGVADGGRSWLLNHLSRRWDQSAVVHEVFGERAGYPEQLASASRSDVSWCTGMTALDKLAELCSQQQWRCLVALMPHMNGVDHPELVALLEDLGLEAQRRGLEVLPLSPALRRLPEVERIVHPVEPHPSRAAHRIMAGEIHRWVTEADRRPAGASQVASPRALPQCPRNWPYSL